MNVGQFPTLGRVPLDKSEGVVKAQNSGAVVFHRLSVRVVEDRSLLAQASCETFTVNQLSAALTNRSFRQPSIRPERQP
jgi:hypothetical protein